jgi:RNA polymerase sigma-70 factor (ECF subfamily)
MDIESSTFSQLVGEAILTEAFESARPRLLEMARRRIGPGLSGRIDEEGVVQNAYLNARRRWMAATEKPTDLYLWLYGIVRDQAIDEIRAATGPNRNAGRDVPWPDSSVAELAMRLAPAQTGPSTAAARKEMSGLVRLAIRQLKPVDQEILSMHYFDGLTFPQIGAVLGMTENAANVRCVRALLRLKKRLPSMGA